MENLPILIFQKTRDPYTVDTDANMYVLRAVILQEQEVGGDVAGQKKKRWVTIGNCQKTLIVAESNYSVTER